MINDFAGNGLNELISRFGGIRVFSPNKKAEPFIYNFDFRNSRGKQTLQGHSMRFICAVDESLLGLRGIMNGGNGYMAQENYIVSITSSWCPKVSVEMFTLPGKVRFGPFSPGTNKITLMHN